LFFGQELLQLAWASHWKVQFPGPVQRFVHVEPAWQMNVQPPPLHDVSHVAPDSHVIVQPPPLHEGTQVVPFLQSNVHEPLKQPGEHVPVVQVHEPSELQPVLASEATSAGESFGASAVTTSWVVTSCVPESVPGEPSLWAPVSAPESSPPSPRSGAS